MSQPFVNEREGSVVIKNAEILNPQAILAAACRGLPADFGVESQMQADLLERRLTRLEQALNLDPLK